MKICAIDSLIAAIIHLPTAFSIFGKYLIPLNKYFHMLLNAVVIAFTTLIVIFLTAFTTPVTDLITISITLFIEYQIPFSILTTESFTKITVIFSIF